MSETFNAAEISKLEMYLQSKFANRAIEVRQRKDIKDSVEVFIADEFTGVIYKDEDEGETSYDFNMAILEIDLPQ